MTALCPRCKKPIEVADSAQPVEARCSGCNARVLVRPKEPSGFTCPACGAVIEGGLAVCPACGLDFKTGRPTRFRAEREREEEPPPAAPVRALLFVGEWLPGLLRLRVLIAAVVVSVIGLGVIAFGLALIGAGIPLSAFAVCGAGIVVYAQGVALLVDGELTLLHEALSNFDGGRWALFFSLLTLPLVALVIIVKIAAR